MQGTSKPGKKKGRPRRPLAIRGRRIAAPARKLSVDGKGIFRDGVDLVGTPKAVDDVDRFRTLFHAGIESLAFAKSRGNRYAAPP